MLLTSNRLLISFRYLRHQHNNYLYRSFSSKMKRELSVALVQMNVGIDRDENLKHAAEEILKATDRGAKLIALPECFNSPYGTQHFEAHAESIPDGITCNMLSTIAKENCIYLVGGTIPERDRCSTLYNTCTVWNPEGKMIAKYRKIHLFDIDIPGEVTFKESSILSPGNELATFHIDDIKIGLGICYDLRFDEFAKLYRLQGCDILIYPAAFTMKTGPRHWELLQRSRALDNQVFVFSISPARAKKGYIAWGHSQITSPWGNVIKQALHEQETVYCKIDLAELDDVRQHIPIYPQRRTDVYNTVLQENE